MINIQDKSKCCGCRACSEVCPKNIIYFRQDDEGFAYPEVDKENCIDCGLCNKVCPFENTNTKQCFNDPRVYATYDNANRSGSSSGGIFYALAKYVIEVKGGWVYGAAFEDHFQLRHIGVDSVKDLERLRGSKYVQSDTNHCFSSIKKLLDKGTFVMFCGTPCQVAGLKGYLHKLYNNLLLADLVCHGVPPQSLFDQHVRYMERKYHSELVAYHFRKNDGWGGCEICDFANNKHIEVDGYDMSPYLHSFMESFTYRESCYQCPFAKVPRQGDITLADFWGVNLFFPKMDFKKGVSMVLMNTKLGLEIWEKIENQLVCEMSNLKDGAAYNPNLLKSSIRPKERDIVFRKLEEKGYDYMVTHDFRVKGYCKRRLLAIARNNEYIRKLHSFIKHILKRIK